MPVNGSVLSSACPLNDLPPAQHEYIHALEQRIVKMELEQKRFSEALIKAGQFIFDSPMSKMFLSAMPKEAQTKLREFFGNGNK